MEPKDKNSQQWRNWFVRHHFGALTAEAIVRATKKELEILREFVADTIKIKK